MLCIILPHLDYIKYDWIECYNYGTNHSITAIEMKRTIIIYNIFLEILCK